jgi:serine/threonine protein kinase
MLVEQWTDKDWWMSVVSSSDSASIKERVVLHLNEFVFCVQVLRLIASNGAVPEGTSLIPLDLSTPDVEEASRRDSESLFRIVEGYRAKSVPQGAVEKLAEYVLRKLRATNSDHGYLHSIEYDDVKLLSLLGRGPVASVLQCEFLGLMAAAKVFRSPSVRVGQREAELLARLRHPNVVQFIGYAVKPNQLMIVMELMQMDLATYLQSQSELPLPLLLAVDIMLQLAEAMNYLHKSRMIHRDLKSYNVLINTVRSKESSFSPSVQVKLADFDLSKLNLYNSTFSRETVGTRPWMAPEVYEDEEDEEKTVKYTKAVDVYSFAMVFFEVLTGKVPFHDRRRTAIRQIVLKGERPILPPHDYCPEDVSALIERCWATMPEDRPQFPEICQTLWQCKARILSPSSPHSSSRKSQPQKHRNDGGDIGGIVTTGNSENLFPGPDISAGDFRATIEYNDVQLENDFLGQGGYACVFKCQLHGEMAAAKLFCPSKTVEVKAVQNEAKLLASLRHPNVVQFKGYAVKENQHYIITELMNQKDLRMYLNENFPLSLPLAVDIMLQIAEGMKYLHESGVMHRDLKAENVLLNVVKNESYISPSVQVKLTDFGLSKSNLNNSRFTTMGVGTAQWRAPEVFQDEQNTEKYTKAADVYSYAMVFLEVLTGKVPWCVAQGKPARPTTELLPSILRGERPTLPPDCPAHLSAFISKCWATRAEDRPEFPEICKFLWQCKG